MDFTKFIQCNRFNKSTLISPYVLASRLVFTLSISSPMIKIAAVGAFPLAGEGGLALEWFVDMVASQR